MCPARKRRASEGCPPVKGHGGRLEVIECAVQEFAEIFVHCLRPVLPPSLLPLIVVVAAHEPSLTNAFTKVSVRALTVWCEDDALVLAPPIGRES